MNEPRLKPLSFPRGPVSRLTALAFGMGLALSAWASDPHGDAHEAPEAPAKSSKAAKGEGARAASKGEAASEGKAESRSEAQDEGKGKSEGKGKGKSDGKGLGELKASVSMSELRDLIDQKIAEVRAKQEPAPVVKVTAPRPRVKRAASAHGEGALAPRGAASAAALAGGHGAGAEGHEVHWAYGGDTGPANWGMLKPEYQQCMLGKRQSPIDIRDGIKVDLEPIQFDYRATPFKVIDNGHTVQVNVEPGNSIMVQGRRYDLIQFHFHRPSEERINGRQYEMVAHLVHKDVEGRLAVVAVLMDQGVAHPMVQQVWNNLPLEKNTEQYAPVMIDMNLMLPEQRQYYTYMGSLTTPPCSEGVLWMVMKQPATMSREQIGIFSRLYQMNARPIQSVSGRLIKDGQ